MEEQPKKQKEKIEFTPLLYRVKKIEEEYKYRRSNEVAGIKTNYVFQADGRQFQLC